LLLGDGGATLRTVDETRRSHMNTTTINTTKFVAMLAAVLLTAAEFLVLDYDAQQRVVDYRAAANAIVHQG